MFEDQNRNFSQIIFKDLKKLSKTTKRIFLKIILRSKDFFLQKNVQGPKKGSSKIISRIKYRISKKNIRGSIEKFSEKNVKCRRHFFFLRTKKGVFWKKSFNDRKGIFHKFFSRTKKKILMKFFSRTKRGFFCKIFQGSKGIL